MNKKKLGLTLLAVALLGADLLSVKANLRLLQAPTPAGGAYDNYWSRQALKKASPSQMALIFPARTDLLPAADLVSWQEEENNFSPDVAATLRGYFFAQTGLSHPWTNYGAFARVKGLGLNNQVLGQYLVKIADAENRPPRDAKLVIEEGRATQFQAHEYGQTFDAAESEKLLARALATGQSQMVLPIKLAAPQIKLGDLNNLGIRELLARGQSDFSGSSLSRINNIRTGASRYQGLLIAPGEEFSFNKYLGPVDAQAGFRPELVIKPEGTVPEFGGGLCQVSSTAFRAAFFAGLPITARRNHSYAVKYYEWIADDLPRAVGLDATIYPGAQDLKFLNDTPGAILIATRLAGKRLYFDFYGTKDNRQVLVDGPHPYDRQASGAVKSKVSRTVRKDREENTVTFESRYVSPLLYPKIYEYPPKITNNQ